MGLWSQLASLAVSLRTPFQKTGDKHSNSMEVLCRLNKVTVGKGCPETPFCSPSVDQLWTHTHTHTPGPHLAYLVPSAIIQPGPGAHCELGHLIV